MASVMLENLSKRYGNGAVAVDDVTLQVHDGELLVIVGPSGCGKTTLLRLIAGLEQPTEGLVRIDGRNVNRVSPADRNIAMVFQDHALYPHMTVRQNMAFGLKMRGVRRGERDEKVRAAAEALDLAALLERKPGALSGGERQRAALARALVRRPQCFLLDEPLSNLDPPLRVKARNLIRTLHRQIETTMIHVTHDQDDAMALGDRIAVMHRGEILQVGARDEIYHQPLSRFVAEFIGSPAMNFIEGRIDRDGLGLMFTDGYELRLPIAASHTVVMQYHAGKPAVAGIRPRDLVDASVAEDHTTPLWARVTMVESWGDQTQVHGETSLGVPIRAHLNSVHEYQVDRHATWCIDPKRVQYFSADEHGRSLLHGRWD